MFVTEMVERSQRQHTHTVSDPPHTDTHGHTHTTAKHILSASTQMRDQKCVVCLPTSTAPSACVLVSSPINTHVTHIVSLLGSLERPCVSISKRSPIRFSRKQYSVSSVFPSRFTLPSFIHVKNMEEFGAGLRVLYRDVHLLLLFFFFSFSLFFLSSFFFGVGWTSRV